MWSLMMFQVAQVAPAPSFLPDNLGEWVAAIGSLLATLSFGFGALIKVGANKREQQLRMEKVEKCIASLEKKVEMRPIEIREAVMALKSEMKEEIDRRFTDHGKRLGSVEEGCNKNGEALQALKISSLDVTSNIREVANLTKQAELLEARLVQASEERSKIRERIAALEERTRT